MFVAILATDASIVFASPRWRAVFSVAKRRVALPLRIADCANGALIVAFAINASTERKPWRKDASNLTRAVITTDSGWQTLALASVQIADLMHRAVVVVPAVTIPFHAASIDAQMLIRALTVVLAPVFIWVFANAINTNLTLRAFDDLSIVVAAWCGIDALIAHAALPIPAIKILMTFGFGHHPSEG